MKLKLFSFIFCWSMTSWGAPLTTTLMSKISTPAGLPLEAASVDFKISIFDKLGTCLIYQETYNPVSMANSKGLISITIGAGTRTYPVAPTTMDVILNNTNSPTLNCQAGGTVTPAETDERRLVLQFNDGNGWQTVPSLLVTSVPYSIHARSAQQLGGFPASDYPRLAAFPTCGPTQSINFNGTTFSCINSGAGTVTSVASANGDITITNGTTTALLTLNSGNGANNIVKLDGAAALPAVSGTNLTNLNATQLTSGALPAARLPAFTGDVVTTVGTAATTISNDVITNVMINSSAAIARSKIAAGTANHLVINAPGGGLSSVGCNNGEIIKYAGGVPTCTADDTGAGDLRNGGNATGAAITMGTTDGQKIDLLTSNLARLTIDSAGNVGVGTNGATSAGTKFEVAGQIVSQQFSTAAGVTAVSFASGNVQLITNAGNSAITLSNMRPGGTYILVIEDTTSRTYTFPGCTNSYYSPANAPTTVGTFSTYSFVVVNSGGNTNCYISWITGYM